MTLATNRSVANSKQEHADDHNAAHEKLNRTVTTDGGEKFIGSTRVKAASVDTVDWALLAQNVSWESGLYTDRVANLGVNIANLQDPQNAAEASIWLQFESKFRNPSGPGPYGSEFHVNFRKPGGASGSQQRPFNMFMEHVTGLCYLEADGNWEFWDSARTTQRAVFDFNGANKAVRLVNGTFLYSTAAVGASTDVMILLERSGAGVADQVFRVDAAGRASLGGIYEQYGGGTGGVLAIANATAAPSTNPVAAAIHYVQGGVPKARTANGHVLTQVAVAQAGTVLRSPLDEGQDAGVAGNGNTMYVAFTVEKEQPVNRVAFFVGTSAGNVQCGIYDASGDVPGNRLTTSGTVACPAAGGAAVAVPVVTLQPGRYFAALTASGAATFRYRSGLGVTQAVKPVYYLDASAFPLNATANPSAVTGENVFLVRPAYV